MKYNLWISITLSSQITDIVVNSGNLVIPFYNINEFTSKLPKDKGYFVNLPMVVRNKDVGRIKTFLKSAGNEDRVQGIFVNNTETLGILEELDFEKKVYLGPGLYIWNKDSLNVLSGSMSGFVYPYELTKHELREIESDKGILCVYGRTPLMVTANCIRNTKSVCKHGKGTQFEYIKDRKGNLLPVFFECDSCMNVIFNPVATSLHENLSDVKFTKDYLLNFTNEENVLINDIINFYLGKRNSFPVSNTTKAYFVHGVE